MSSRTKCLLHEGTNGAPYLQASTADILRCQSCHRVVGRSSTVLAISLGLGFDAETSSRTKAAKSASVRLFSKLLQLVNKL